MSSDRTSWSDGAPPSGRVWAAAWAAGGVTFPSILALYQHQVCARLPMLVAHRRVVSGAAGAVAVAVAGTAAAAVFDGVLRAGGSPTRDRPAPSLALYGTYAVSAVVCFRMLGGRFSATAPSDLAHVGAFASREARLPAKDAGYASDGARAQIARFGRRLGCHSCGRRFRTEFICDHQPPNALKPPPGTQMFYPQCRPCSQQQAGAMSSGQRTIVTHASSLRLQHLWLPLGPLLALTFHRCRPPATTDQTLRKAPSPVPTDYHAEMGALFGAQSAVLVTDPRALRAARERAVARLAASRDASEQELCRHDLRVLQAALSIQQQQLQQQQQKKEN